MTNNKLPRPAEYSEDGVFSSPEYVVLHGTRQCTRTSGLVFETLTLCDTCEECHLIENMHPVALKLSLNRALALYGDEEAESTNDEQCCR